MPSLLNTSSSPFAALVKPVGLGQAFGAMVRANTQFTHDAQVREHLVKACHHAWNIGVLTSTAEREVATTEHGIVLAGQVGGRRRLASSETELLRALVKLRRDCFPFLTRTISAVEIAPGQGTDRLTIFSGGAALTADVTWQPTPEKLSDMQADLQSLASRVPALQADLETWIRGGAMVSDVWATRLCNQCRLLLLELSTQRSAVIGLRALNPDRADHQAFEISLSQMARVEQWVLTLLHAMGAA